VIHDSGQRFSQSEALAARVCSPFERAAVHTIAASLFAATVGDDPLMRAVVLGAFLQLGQLLELQLGDARRERERHLGVPGLRDEALEDALARPRRE